MPTIDEIFDFQHWMETACRNAIVTHGVFPSDQLYISRDRTTMQSPCITIHFTNGPVVQRQQVGQQVAFFFNTGMKTPYNTFGGLFTFGVRTNRDDRQGHSKIVGRLRASMQYFVLAGKPGAPVQNWQSQIVTLTDIFEQGCIDNFEDESDTDESTLTFELVWNVKDTAWPQTF